MRDGVKAAAVGAIYGYPHQNGRAIKSLCDQGIIKPAPLGSNFTRYELQSPYAVGIVDGKPWVGKVFEVRRD